MPLKNSNRFHLAILAGDLTIAKKFYCDLLGCKAGNYEEGAWVDINFWGNELTLHQSDNKGHREPHPTDAMTVCVPHFGVHLSAEDFEEVKGRLDAVNYEYLESPYRRFKGTQQELETFFIEDPNGNAIEVKTMMNPEILFDVVLPEQS